MDRRDEVCQSYECGESVAVLAQRHEVRPATIRRWLRDGGVRLDPRPYRGLSRRTQEPYRPRPTTDKARRVWAAWQAQPGAKLAVLARTAGVSEAYASRLIGHWKAQEAA